MTYDGAARDRELIEQRRLRDMQEFLSAALLPENAPRLSSALNAGRDLMADGKWHPWNRVVAAMLDASDVALKTVETQLRNAIAVKFLERTGEWWRGVRGRPPIDTRKLRLIKWPKLEVADKEIDAHG